MNLSTHKINNPSEVLPLYEENPERFMRFYNAVYLLLCSIPERGALRVTERCKPSSYGLFIKCACLCMMEEQQNHEPTDALLEFSDDYTEIHRSAKFTKSITKAHFYSLRQK